MDNPRDRGFGWVGIDFDGTLAHSDKQHGPEKLGEPIDSMVRKVRRMLREGRDVRLFTARKQESYPALRRWMQEHLGEILQITNTKDHKMQALYDDRAVTVPRNSGEPLRGAEEAVFAEEKPALLRRQANPFKVN